MTAAGLLLLAAGVVMVYSGLTGQSVLGELARVLRGDKPAAGAK